MSRGFAAACASAGLALALRLSLTLAIGVNPDFFDADGYHGLALTALGGAPVETIGHPPGYTWFLMGVYLVFGVRPLAVYLVQDLLSALSVFLVARAAGTRWGGRAALAAGLLMAANAYLAVFPTVLVTETLSTTGVAIVVWLLVPGFPRVSFPRLLGAAAVAGSLALVRTGFLLFVPALALLSLVPLLGPGPRRALATAGKAALVALTGAFFAAGPAVYRSRETGVVRLWTPHDGLRLWIGNNPNATGRYEPMPDEPSVGQPGIPDLDSLDRVARERAWRFIFGQPWRQLELVPKRLSLLLATPKRDLIYLYAHGWAGERPPWALRGFLGWLAVSHALLLAGAVAGFLRTRDDLALLAAGLIVLCCVAPYLVAFGDARFLQPAYPGLAFAAGAAFARFSSPIPGRVRALGWILGAVLAANTAYDLSASMPAVKAVLEPGGSALRPPYHFAR